MKRMFAKCFLQKYSEGRKSNKCQDSVILTNTPEENGKINEQNEQNIATKAITQTEINHNGDKVEESHEGNEIMASNEKKEIKVIKEIIFLHII